MPSRWAAAAPPCLAQLLLSVLRWPESVQLSFNRELLLPLRPLPLLLPLLPLLVLLLLLLLLRCPVVQPLPMQPPLAAARRCAAAVVGVQQPGHHLFVRLAGQLHAAGAPQAGGRRWALGVCLSLVHV